jgi:serine/threonine-protein kinase
MARAEADRDLLFGLLALQNGLIEQSQLVAAFQAWTLDRSRPLAEHLAGRGDLDSDDRAAVEALVLRHLKKHGGTEQSLAAIPIRRTTCESLARVGNPVVEATLARVGTMVDAAAKADGDETATYSVGTSTSDGQRFRVLRPHAKGGLGAVFVALDTELHREVALKQILDKHADDAVSRTRFILEAEVTGALEHPGIVPVYGLGAYADGRPYYAMRFVRGESLKEAIEQFHGDPALGADPGSRSLGLRKLLRRFIDVCNAVEYAHARGVLHRDIKPANIIVGKHGETLVVDWGLAKVTGRSDPAAGERTLVPSSASGSSETLPGSALGTPAYMSPEQAEGDLERLGPRSDVYSLGATLYCLLIGKPPFEGDAADVIPAVLRGQFRPPREHAPATDRALEAVCLKAMAVKPADRYATPRALAEDVERWMADERVSAWREPKSRTLLRWLTRHRVGVTATGVAALVALVGMAAVLAVQARANTVLKATNTELARAHANVTRANADLAASNERERARFALAQEAIRTFHTGVSEDILLKEEEFQALRTKLLRGAREFYRKLEALLHGQKDRDSRLALGQAYFEVGELTRQLDSIEEAREIHQRAVALLEDLSRDEPGDPQPRRWLARALRALAVVMDSIGRKDEAFAPLERSRNLLRALADADPADHELRAELARLEIYLAMAMLNSDRSTEALEGARRAREILEAHTDGGLSATPLQPQLVVAYEGLAVILQKTERRDEALRAYQRARELGEALFRANPEQPETTHELARTLGNMGNCLAGGGQHLEALAAFRRAREVLEALGRASPTLFMAPAGLAWIDALAASSLIALGRDGEALEALERARTTREILVKANPAITRNREQLLWIHEQAADIHRRARRTPETLAALERARDVAASLVNAHPDSHDYDRYLAAACADMGDLLSMMGKCSEAQASFDKAISIHRAILQIDPTNPASRLDLASMHRREGVALRKCGQPAAAVAPLREAIAVLGAQSAPPAGHLYNAACVHSLLSGVALERGSGLTSAESRAEADAAVANLRAAVAAGWRDPAQLLIDTDLDPLRSRLDFQLLFLDMAFPDQPFAAAPPADTSTVTGASPGGP